MIEILTYHITKNFPAEYFT